MPDLPASDMALALLQKLEAAGVELCIPGMYVISAPDALRFLDDPDAVYAELEGVTKEQYRAWVQSDYGTLQCAARTKAGHRCKCIIAGCHAYWLRPAKWVERQGELCPLHQRLAEG